MAHPVSQNYTNINETAQECDCVELDMNVNPNICDGQDIINCLAIKRITKMLQFYHSNHNNYDGISKYVEIYQLNLLSDYHHVLDKHFNEDAVSKRQSNKQFQWIYKEIQNKVSCDIEKCKIHKRNNRQRETVNIHCNDEKLEMFIDLIDTIHCYLLHSVDIGYREIHPFNSGNKETDHSLIEDASNSYDSNMKELRVYLSSKRKKLETVRGERRLFNSKFMTNLSSNMLYETNQSNSNTMEDQKMNEQKIDNNDMKESETIIKRGISMEGYLKKRSLHIKQFRKRFIILKHNRLDCYKNHKKTKMTETIDLKFYKQASLSQKAVGQFQLIPVNDKHTIRMFSADSMDEVEEWINSINQSIKGPEKGSHRMNNTAVTKENDSIFCFGERRDYWNKKGKYKSIKDEVVSNKIYTITIKQYKKAYKKANYLTRRSPNIKKLKCCYAAHDVYGMTRYAPPSTENILSVILYTDYDSLSYRFSQTFRKILVDESEEYTEKRGHEFWNWSKTLIETVNAFGTLMRDSKISVFYHGVSLIYFNSFVTAFNSPTSTTTRLQIAYQFASNDGIIVEMAKMDNWCGDMKYFNCTFVSCFAAEEERLFIQPHDANHHLQLLSIRNMSTDENYKKYIQAINIFQRVTEDDRFKKMESWESSVKGFDVTEWINYFILILTEKDDGKCPEYIRGILDKWTNSVRKVNIDVSVIQQHVPKIMFYEYDEDLVHIDKINKVFKLVETVTIDNLRCMDTISPWNKIASMLKRINYLQYSQLKEINIRRERISNMLEFYSEFDKFQSLCGHQKWILTKHATEKEFTYTLSR